MIWMLYYIDAIITAVPTDVNVCIGHLGYSGVDKLGSKKIKSDFFVRMFFLFLKEYIGCSGMIKMQFFFGIKTAQKRLKSGILVC